MLNQNLTDQLNNQLTAWLKSKPTNYMQYSPSREPNSSSTSQEILHILQKLQVQYCVHNNPSLSPLSARQLHSGPPILLPKWPVHIWDPLSHFVACLFYTVRSCRPAICPTSKLEGHPLSTVGDCFLTLSNPIFLPTAYSPALICFGQERGWWITCKHPTVLKEKNIEKQKEYNLRYLLAKVRTTWGKASDRLRQQANRRNKNRVGHLPTSERKRKIILSDEVWRRIRKG